MSDGFRTLSKGAIRRQREEGRDERVETLTVAVADLRTREEFVAAISGLWRDAQTRFLAIGRYLTRAKERLPHGEFEAMVKNDLPFTPPVAFQLRAAADAIDAGRLPAEQVPPSYSTVYQLAQLTDTELERAKDAGLLRPDVRREEVMAFKRQVRAAVLPASTPRVPEVDHRAELIAERGRLLKRLEEIDRLLSDDGEGT